MEAWLLDESPGAYRYGEVDLPDPGPGEVWVRVVTSALNHLDLWMRKAMPKPPMFPMVPGCDGAGTVAAVGGGGDPLAGGGRGRYQPVVRLR